VPPLTGLQIQKLLPKTNCKECGSNTCLAFAMKLAAKKIELSACPYVSDEATAKLAAAAEPPIRTVKVGPLPFGGETVMFRHDKTLVNQTGLGVAVGDGDLEKLAAYRYERVGEELRPDVVSVAGTKGLAKVAELWDQAIVVRSEDPAVLREAAEMLKGRKPLLASATPSTVDELGKVAKETGSALAVAAKTFDELVAMTAKLKESGFRDIVLELRADSLCEHAQNSSIVRRGALRAGVKTLGYPILKYIDTGNPVDDAIEAGIEICRYGSLAIVPAFDPAVFAPLLALRQNIYTDPQKPIQVEPKIHPIGEPDENSPVFVTTNFSLTYFLVSGEIENCGISAWLMTPECEGMSVLTAWAAGKFGGDKIGAFAKEAGLEAQTKCRRIVIPGYVAQISGELEEAMPGWEVLVGPQEAGDIESFVKNVLKK
jgi:acetyl-CoA decarbonylase/synthase complex subunit gamma